MLAILRNTSFRRLYAAQIVALLGTGLATMALALLAYDLAGPDAGAVLGTALAIKMAIRQRVVAAGSQSGCMAYAAHQLRQSASPQSVVHGCMCTRRSSQKPARS